MYKIATLPREALFLNTAAKSGMTETVTSYTAEC
jgi:hypothetical protein